jgi:hypothetical protein
VALAKKSPSGLPKRDAVIIAAISMPENRAAVSKVAEGLDVNSKAAEVFLDLVRREAISLACPSTSTRRKPMCSARLPTGSSKVVGKAITPHQLWKTSAASATSACICPHVATAARVLGMPAVQRLGDRNSGGGIIDTTGGIDFHPFADCSVSRRLVRQI